MEPELFLDVTLDDDVKLDDYNDALSTYKEWKSIYREIKLNLLLEQGKRIEFDIDNISKFITLDKNDIGSAPSVSELCGNVSGMVFILNNNKIEKLTLKIHIIENLQGKVVKELLKEDIKLVIKQRINGSHLYFNMIPTSLQEINY